MEVLYEYRNCVSFFYALLYISVFFFDDLLSTDRDLFAQLYNNLLAEVFVLKN